MARIPLRTYDREIENLIDRGQIEEAIAHAKNILKQYPKHIETYRLLGKAFLESQRYSEASDILQRVLSVIPDDFVSQLGVSIIREDEGNLDAAIWHMERAFEVQPFNRAVQDELRRLYGRRDGLEPPRVRLTRGSLVRMYAKGELFPQAIAETRAALAEDPQRVDLQVLLARMYYLTGQKVEAAEIASALISKIPYCLEANRILMEILPNTSRAEDARVFQRRVYDLDPYAQFISPNAPTSAQVPDQSVMAEHVDWQPSGQESQAPDWARNIGVKWDQGAEEALPDWLNAVGAAPEQSTQAPPAEKQAGDEIVPDFMRSAGWAASTSSAEETPVANDLLDEESSENLETADIPDWLQSMAPQMPASDTQEEASTDWLAGILPAAGAAGLAAAQPEPQASTDNEDIDWLSTAPDTPETSAGITQPADEAALPSWMLELGASGAENEQPEQELTTGNAPEDELPAWLRAEPETSALPSLDAAEDQSVSQPEAEAMQWFQEPEQPAEPVVSDELPAWLREELTVPESGATPSEQTAEPEFTAEVFDLTPAPETPAETLPEYPLGSRLDETPLAEIPGWNQEAPAQPETLPETIEQSPAAGDEELPDWLASLGDVSEPTADEGSSEATPAVETSWDQPTAEFSPIETNWDSPTLPAEEPPQETTQAEMPVDLGAGDMDAALAWLEGLAAKQGAEEGSLQISSPEERPETPPEWLSELAASSADTEATTAEAAQKPSLEVAEAAQASDAIPDWLREDITPSLSADTAPETPLPAQDLPDWLIPANAGASESQAVEMPTWLSQAAEPVISAQDDSTQPAQLQETTPEPQSPAVPENMDEALAWLEGLALKQGADEESLKISQPEDRVETPPDWIARLSQEDQTPVAEVDHSIEDTQPIRIKPSETVEEVPAVNAEMETPAVETAAFEAPETAGEIPDWLAGLEDEPLPQQEAEVPSANLAPVDVDESTAVNLSEPASFELEQETSPAQPVAPQESAGIDLNDMDSAMAWLESLAEKQGAEEGSLQITPPESRSDTPPEWVTALAAQEQATAPVEAPLTSEEQAAPETTPEPETPVQPVSWSPAATEPAAEIPPASEEPALDAEIPDWLLNYEAEQQRKAQPWQAPPETAQPAVVQPAAADDSVTLWLQQHHPEPGAIPLEETGPTVAQEPGWGVTPAAEAIPAPEGSALARAQSALDKGNIQEAADLYTQLVNTGEGIETTIESLRQALHQHPVDVEIWQVLGDAYIRADKIQEALDAYTKAEELLR